MNKIEKAIQKMVQCSIDSTSTPSDFNIIASEALEALKSITGFDLDTYGLAELSNGVILVTAQHRFVVPFNTPYYNANIINEDPVAVYGKKMLLNHKGSNTLFNSNMVIDEGNTRKEREAIGSKIQQIYQPFAPKPELMSFPVLQLSKSSGNMKGSWITLIRDGSPFSDKEMKKARLYMPIIISCLNARIANAEDYHQLLNLAQKFNLTPAEFRFIWAAYTILNNDSNRFSLCYKDLDRLLGVTNSAKTCIEVLEKITGKKRDPNQPAKRLTQLAFILGKLSPKIEW